MAKTKSKNNDGITSDLTLLGSTLNKPSKKLETFPNQHVGRRYWVKLVFPEFTAVCPMTGQPDFATITIRYIPNERVVESKSLKLYFWSFRNEGIFHEHVINQIMDDLIAALDPLEIHVTGEFAVRGGIAITVEASHVKA